MTATSIPIVDLTYIRKGRNFERNVFQCWKMAETHFMFGQLTESRQLSTADQDSVNKGNQPPR